MANDKKQNKTIAMVLMIVLLVGGGWLVFNQQEKPQGPDLDADIVGEDCLSREGIDFLMCCLRNNAEGELAPFPCNDALVTTQALFTAAGVGTLNIDGVCFAVKATNDGNVNVNFDVTSATTTFSGGGDAAGAAEFDSSWADVIAKPVASGVTPGSDATFSMECITNPVRFSSGFFITDGQYTSTVTTQVTSPGSGATNTDDTTIVMDIAQEDIGFSVAIEVI